ncbi:hypothetical protein TNCV_375091 [Trichonephila clavipes]|nr:hypothetical protein TNCV_375091 [Trichonephila clavipes]
MGRKKFSLTEEERQELFALAPLHIIRLLEKSSYIIDRESHQKWGQLDIQITVFQSEERRVVNLYNGDCTDVRVKKLQLGKSVVLWGIPSHCGTSGNEMADSLAKEDPSVQQVTNNLAPLRIFK